MKYLYAIGMIFYFIFTSSLNADSPNNANREHFFLPSIGISIAGTVVNFEFKYAHGLSTEFSSIYRGNYLWNYSNETPSPGDSAHHYIFILREFFYFKSWIYLFLGFGFSYHKELLHKSLNNGTLLSPPTMEVNVIEETTGRGYFFNLGLSYKWNFSNNFAMQFRAIGFMLGDVNEEKRYLDPQTKNPVTLPDKIAHNQSLENLEIKIDNKVVTAGIILLAILPLEISFQIKF